MSKLSLLLVILATALIHGIGCQVVNEDYHHAQRMAREDALARALNYTRQAIRDYTADHGKSPRQLDDLVTSGYFDVIPVDPFTNKPDWTVEYHECNPPIACERLIKNVHSSSKEKSSKNNLYSEW